MSSDDRIILPFFGLVPVDRVNGVLEPINHCSLRPCDRCKWCSDELEDKDGQLAIVCERDVFE